MDHSIGPPTSVRVGSVGPQCYVLNGSATMLHQQQYSAAVPLLLPQSINSSTTPPPYNIQNHRKLTHVNTSDNKLINGYNQTYSVVQQTPQVVSVITQRNHNSSIPHTINNNFYQSKVTSNTVQLPSTANHGNTSSNLYYFDGSGSSSSQPQPIDHHAHSSSREAAQMRLKQNATQVSASPQSYYNERLPTSNRNNMSTVSASFYDLQRWPQSQPQTQQQYNNNTTQVQNTYNNPNSYYSGTANVYNNNNNNNNNNNSVQVQNQQNVVAPPIHHPQQPTSLEPSSRVVVPDIESELSHLVSIPVSDNLTNNIKSPSLPIVKCSKPSFMDSYLKFLNGNEETRENNVPPPVKKLLLPLAQPTAKPAPVSTKKNPPPPPPPNNHNQTKTNTKSNASNSLTLDDDPRYFPLAKSTCRFSSSDSDDDCWSKKLSTTTSTNTVVNNVVRNSKITSKNVSPKKLKTSKTILISDSKAPKLHNQTSNQPKRRQSSQRIVKSKTVIAVKTAIRNNVDATEESGDSDIDPAWTP